MSKFSLVLFRTILVIAVLMVLFPFVWALMLSLKTNQEITGALVTFFPKGLNLEGYRTVFTETPLGVWFVNSIFVTSVVVAITSLTSALAGYIFAKFVFKFKNAIFILILATMMVPFQVKMIPTYLICVKLNLINTLWALILPSVVSAFGIFLCRQHAENIPTELMDAGRIEGAGEFRLFFSLILPLLKPSIAALATFTFIGTWNNYLWPLIVIDDINKMTLPIALNFFSSNRFTDYNAIMSASVIVLIPVIVVFLIFQKNFIDGMTISGMK